MSHEIEADYREEWDNELTQCRHCTSYGIGDDGEGYCHEAKAPVPPTAHCDFFQSVD